MSSFIKHIKAPINTHVQSPNQSNTIALTVCINFADKLHVSLQANMMLFKKMYIVTEQADDKTITVATTHGAHVIFCEEAYINGAKFNKAGLLRHAQNIISKTHKDDWIALIDADTIIPPTIWQNQQSFNPTAIYLLDRKLYANPEALKEDKPHTISGGCGFFQLYYDKSKRYQAFSTSAADCDILFQNLFKAQITLPGHCIHLGFSGQDWNGRISNVWT